MVYWALPSIQMAPADILSCWDDMDTSLDNTDVQLLSSNAFDQQIHAIDIALADKSKTYHPATLSSSKPSTKWRRSSPYVTDQEPRIEPLMMGAVTSTVTITTDTFVPTYP